MKREQTHFPKLIDPTLALYLKEISRIPLLTPEEERRLAERARKGDKKAREKLIVSNLRYVVHIAFQYRNHGLSLSDLINEGNLGLIKAVDRYDVRKHTRLLTYASWWIRYAITSALAKRKLVALPLKHRNIAQRVRNNYQRVATKYGRDPSLEELASELKLDISELSDAFLSSKSELSIDYVQDTNLKLEGLLESSLPSPEEEHRRRELKEEIKKVLKILTDEERYIIRELFGISEIPKPPKSLSAIGREMGISRERVRQLKERALHKLRLQINRKDLKKLLA